MHLLATTTRASIVAFVTRGWGAKRRGCRHDRGLLGDAPAPARRAEPGDRRLHHVARPQEDTVTCTVPPARAGEQELVLHDRTSLRIRQLDATCLDRITGVRGGDEQRAGGQDDVLLAPTIACVLPGEDERQLLAPTVQCPARRRARRPRGLDHVGSVSPRPGRPDRGRDGRSARSSARPVRTSAPARGDRGEYPQGAGRALPAVEVPRANQVMARTLASTALCQVDTVGTVLERRERRAQPAHRPPRTRRGAQPEARGVPALLPATSSAWRNPAARAGPSIYAPGASGITTASS